MNEEVITAENCGVQLELVRESAVISRNKLAKILGVPDSTIGRIEEQKSIPRNGFLNKLRALQVIGLTRFKDMADDRDINRIVADAKSMITVKGVIYGLMALVTDDAVDLRIPLGDDKLDSLGYGIINSIRKICAANSLGCEEKEGQLVLKNSKPKTSSVWASVKALESVNEIAKMRFPSKNMKKWCQAAGQLIKRRGAAEGIFLRDIPQIISIATGEEQAQLCSGLFWSAWIDQMLFKVAEKKIYEKFRALFPLPKLYADKEKNYADPGVLLNGRPVYKLPSEKLLLEDKQEFWGEIRLWLRSLGKHDVIDKAFWEFYETQKKLPKNYRLLFEPEKENNK